MSTPMPKIVCIIGSSRFKALHMGHAQRITLQGKIVLQRGFYHHVDLVPVSAEQIRLLDDLLLRRIDLADEVYVVCPNGYIGESTRTAIAYATSRGKPIAYSDPPIGVNP